MSAESRPSILGIGKSIPLPGEPCGPLEELLQVDAPHNKPVRDRWKKDVEANKKAVRDAAKFDNVIIYSGKSN